WPGCAALSGLGWGGRRGPGALPRADRFWPLRGTNPPQPPQHLTGTSPIARIYLHPTKKPPYSESRDTLQGGWLDDSGDDRLSRQGLYQGPGGLSGRVGEGNGGAPASMVAGKAPGRRSSRAGHVDSVGRPHTSRWHSHLD